MNVIKKHCSAKPDKVQVAIRQFKKRREDAEALVAGMEFINGTRLREAKAKLRQLKCQSATSAPTAVARFFDWRMKVEARSLGAN
jgi:hypothetical protein